MFGLGDSSYPKFNWAALKLSKRLIQIGADEFFERGLADEQHEEGLEASFIPWLSGLRQRLLEQYPLPEGFSIIPDDQALPPPWILVPSNTNFVRQQGPYAEVDARILERSGRSSLKQKDDLSKQLAVTLDQNTRVTPQAHWQDVRHMVFSSKLKTSYSPGDVLVVHPQNSAASVNELISRMQWQDVADISIRCELIESQDSGGHIPLLPFVSREDVPTTLRSLLTSLFDINAIPRRSFFSAIAHFTSNESHKERLLEFTRPEYVDEFYDYATRPRRSILEVLQEFDSVDIPWQLAVNIFPKLRGRQFSIASGGSLKEDSDGSARFELLVAIVKYKTVIKRLREGVCSKYLADLRPGAKLWVDVERGGSHFQTHARQPVIMVGPGTGIAPLRSLLLERQSLIKHLRPSPNSHNSTAGSAGDTIGENLLFFGCRSQHSDYFFKDEWEVLSREIPLRVVPAFSRDQQKKIYVQDLIQETSSEVFRLLDQGATIYVCGSSGKMPQAVRAALLQVIKREGQVEDEGARHYLDAIEKQGKYKQETW